jgi:DNA-binding response OmpR family regulator
MSKQRILVAEDDTNIRNGLFALLQAEGYDVCIAKDGEEAIKRYTERKPDLVILDIMMPKKSGYDVCRAIRSKDLQTPLIMLTAKGEEIDKVLGLGLGADDYITKPFSTRELVARVAAVLRRSAVAVEVPAEVKGTFKIGKAEIDPKRYEVKTKESVEALSDKEMKLLQYFHQHPGEVLSRDALLNAVWGIDYFGNTRTLDQHVALVRKKLGSSAVAIQTVHGVGYRMATT